VFHQRFGGPHAEINALTDCRNGGFDPAGSTVYVTLEPCCHTGKTGPCTRALTEAKVSAVVAAVQDPSDKVAGKGFAQLRQAGIDLTVGICEAQARRLNAPFFKFAKTARPWWIAKWAQSIDGKLAWRNPPAEGNWISGAQSRQDVHRLRRRCQAILVGVNTVITDNPRLTIRIPGQSIEPAAAGGTGYSPPNTS
jgi:diaminohydroxyphosphoribosylaminopyrimidine deaminase/5-amino-6-(5-phosphoribosylamino)uracil reductase